jgi:hypothetical protein
MAKNQSSAKDTYFRHLNFQILFRYLVFENQLQEIKENFVLMSLTVNMKRFDIVHTISFDHAKSLNYISSYFLNVVIYLRAILALTRFSTSIFSK